MNGFVGNCAIRFRTNSMGCCIIWFIVSSLRCCLVGGSDSSTSSELVDLQESLSAVTLSIVSRSSLLSSSILYVLELVRTNIFRFLPVDKAAVTECTGVLHFPKLYNRRSIICLYISSARMGDPDIDNTTVIPYFKEPLALGSFSPLERLRLRFFAGALPVT